MIFLFMESIKSRVSKDFYNYLIKYKDDCLKGKYTGIVNIVSRYHKEYLEELIALTNFLSINAKPCERLYCLYNKITKQPKCKYCDKEVSFDNVLVGYHSICKSRDCINKKTNETYNEKYIDGRKSKDIINKVKQTKLERYGSENYNNIEKIKQTNLSKYETEYAISNKDVIKKSKLTKLERYGDEYYTNREKAVESHKKTLSMNKENIINKKENTMLERYGVKSSLQLKNVRDAAVDGKVKKYIEKAKDLCEKNNVLHLGYNKQEGLHLCRCKKCNSNFKVTKQYILYHKLEEDLSFCPNCGNIKRSKFENEVCDFLKQQNINYICNYKFYYTSHNYYECDIFLPEYNIGIECNGVYWHSELYRDKKYHINKKNFIEEKGVNLIFIWEDNWKNSIKREIIKSRIMSKINLTNKIYARKCKIKEISYKEASDFLTINHLYGSSKSKYNIGLFYNNTLVSVMTFSKARKMISSNSNGFEMVRYASKNNTTIIGGMSKIINYFQKTYNIDTIYSYVDLDWSKLKDNSYEKIGFKIIKKTEPDYWWCVNGIRENRVNYMKHILIKMGYDCDKSESEIMYNNGHYKIYGCGNLLVEIKKRS